MSPEREFIETEQTLKAKIKKYQKEAPTYSDWLRERLEALAGRASKQMEEQRAAKETATQRYERERRIARDELTKFAAAQWRSVVVSESFGGAPYNAAVGWNWPTTIPDTASPMPSTPIPPAPKWEPVAPPRYFITIAAPFLLPSVIPSAPRPEPAKPAEPSTVTIRFRRKIVFGEV